MHSKLNFNIMTQLIMSILLIALISTLLFPVKINANEIAKNLVPKQNKSVDLLKILNELNREEALYQQLLENYHQGKYLEALPLVDNLLSIYKSNKAQLGISKIEMSMRFNDIATIYYTLGYLEKAKPLYQQALKIREKEMGLDHSDTAQTLNNLAALYYVQRDFEQAESLFKRALTIKKNAEVIDSLSIATSLNNLAKVYESLKDFDKARLLFNKVLTIRETGLGKEAPLTIQSINNLAMLHHSLEEFEQAQILLEQALKIRQKVLGNQHPDTAESLNNLATLHKMLGRHKKAQSLYIQALNIWQLTLGENHPKTQLVLTNLADNHLSQEHWLEAYTITARLLAFYENSLDPIKHITQKSDLATKRKQLNQSYQMQLHIKASERILNQSNTTNPKPQDIIKRTLVAMQLAHDPKNTQSMIITALKLASEDTRRKKQVNKLINALYKRDKASHVYINSLTSKKQNQTQLNLARKNAEVDVTQSLNTLKQDWPIFNGIINPSPITIDEIQTLLLPHEAILTYLTSDDESYLIVIRKDTSPYLFKLNVTKSQLQKEINELRVGVKAYKSINSEGKSIQIIQDYDMDLANKLYNQLIQPVTPKLNGITHLITVPEGSLYNLSFAALVTKPHKGNDKAYDQAHWLIKDYSLSQLPSLVSLRLVRQHKKGMVAKEPFLGFGDPALKDIKSSLDEKKTQGYIPLPFLSRSNNILSKTRELNELGSLHFAGAELKTMATKFNADKNTHVYLRERATETQLKELSKKGILKKQKILAFATHALLADDSKDYGGIQSAAESGLVFTPPKTPTKNDDGYLTATEASQLDLNADWVLLSACNTGFIEKNKKLNSKLVDYLFWQKTFSMQAVVIYWLLSGKQMMPQAVN